jgi:2-methylisocitrate lyase-like PEP mutase family enzyme
VTLAEKAERLRDLHVPGRPLVLPNAWDVASARLVVEAGFPVVATSSAAVAWSLGYDDGQAAPVDAMLAAAGRIAQAVDLPVTVDAEAGYDLTARELVDRLLAAGLAGCNLEDTDHASGGLTDSERQATWLAEVREAAEAAGVPLVINARVDVFHGAGSRPEPELLEPAIERGSRYLAAGADCVYPILAAGEATIAGLVEGIPGPVNILYRQGTPHLPRLVELGVARVSFGAGLYRLTYQRLGETLGRIAHGAPPW